MGGLKLFSSKLTDDQLMGGGGGGSCAAQTHDPPTAGLVHHVLVKVHEVHGSSRTFTRRTGPLQEVLKTLRKLQQMFARWIKESLLKHHGKCSN